jgi:hypothetical protein
VDILKLDLEKYKKWLWGLSEGLEQLPYLERRSERLAWIGYCFLRREILGKQTPKGQIVKEAFENERIQIETQIDKIKNMKAGYLADASNEIKGVYFLPSMEEREMLDSIFKTSIKKDIEEFNKDCNVSALAFNDLKYRRLEGLSYYYTDYYIDSRLIVVLEGKRQEVFNRFMLDYCEFQFAKYLQNLGSNRLSNIKESIDKEAIVDILQLSKIVDENKKMIGSYALSATLWGACQMLIKYRYFPLGMTNEKIFNAVAAMLIDFDGVIPKNQKGVPNKAMTKAMERVEEVMLMKRQGI